MNRRIAPVTPDWESPTGPFNAAENFLIEGAFNVNSLSVDAWRAILSGLRNHNLKTVYGGIENNAEFLYGMLMRPLDGSFRYEGQDEFSAEVWNRSRSLSTEEIDALARAIVDEIRERGPFLSLANFVNRSLQGPPAHVEKGALQAAVELAEVAAGVGLNEGLGGDQVDPSYLDMEVPYPELFADRVFEGAPGRLTQADLLAALGPILSSRSDTFRIRAYGEASDTGNPSKAWCEAIVRRIPDKIDPNEAIEVPSSVSSFGRRFEVVSFRWLPPQEENPAL